MIEGQTLIAPGKRRTEYQVMKIRKTCVNLKRISDGTEFTVENRIIRQMEVKDDNRDSGTSKER